MPKDLEKELYPLVERWLKRYLKCFKTASNTGLKYSRADVIGVRDVGGDMCGEIETVCVEVKKGREPFATASGQASGYRVYGNRVYLAERRKAAFTLDERDIASNLGIGLIQIQGRTCKEILSSPFYRPIVRFNLLVLERMALGQCRVCGSFFETGKPENRFSNLTRERLKTAIEKEKGMMFWNREVSDRKQRLKIRNTTDGSTYERRFICPDCISSVFSQLVETDE